ncbi:uncharacterized protein NEMAJ01_0126 [Nematocida major]|uniref:uncharacterized protein n=1 Tax=Nematocida major TaxID=1912982 RepID=UPI0020083CB2|nr:uncharacterized protein NEMAJ01_0126 [Nematocida major]KAH9385230.1 hypothetical protein NEMAJ01_0126 [Nematocida major]
MQSLIGSMHLLVGWEWSINMDAFVVNAMTKRKVLIRGSISILLLCLSLINASAQTEKMDYVHELLHEISEKEHEIEELKNALRMQNLSEAELKDAYNTMEDRAERKSADSSEKDGPDVASSLEKSDQPSTYKSDQDVHSEDKKPSEILLENVSSENEKPGLDEEQPMDAAESTEDEKKASQDELGQSPDDTEEADTLSSYSSAVEPNSETQADHDSEPIEADQSKHSSTNEERAGKPIGDDDLAEEELAKSSPENSEETPVYALSEDEISDKSDEDSSVADMPAKDTHENSLEGQSNAADSTEHDDDAAQSEPSEKKEEPESRQSEPSSSEKQLETEELFSEMEEQDSKPETGTPQDASPSDKDGKAEDLSSPADGTSDNKAVQSEELDGVSESQEGEESESDPLESQTQTPQKEEGGTPQSKDEPAALDSEQEHTEQSEDMPSSENEAGPNPAPAENESSDSKTYDTGVYSSQNPPNAESVDEKPAEASSEFSNKNEEPLADDRNASPSSKPIENDFEDNKAFDEEALDSASEPSVQAAAPSKDTSDESAKSPLSSEDGESADGSELEQTQNVDAEPQPDSAPANGEEGVESKQAGTDPIANQEASSDDSVASKELEDENESKKEQDGSALQSSEEKQGEDLESENLAPSPASDEALGAEQKSASSAAIDYDPENTSPEASKEGSAQLNLLDGLCCTSRKNEYFWLLTPEEESAMEDSLKSVRPVRTTDNPELVNFLVKHNAHMFKDLSGPVTDELLSQCLARTVSISIDLSVYEKGDIAKAFDWSQFVNLKGFEVFGNDPSTVPSDDAVSDIVSELLPVFEKLDASKRVVVFSNMACPSINSNIAKLNASHMIFAFSTYFASQNEKTLSEYIERLNPSVKRISLVSFKIGMGSEDEYCKNEGWMPADHAKNPPAVEVVTVAMCDEDLVKCLLKHRFFRLTENHVLRNNGITNLSAYSNMPLLQTRGLILVQESQFSKLAVEDLSGFFSLDTIGVVGCGESLSIEADVFNPKFTKLEQAVFDDKCKISVSGELEEKWLSRIKMSVFGMKKPEVFSREYFVCRMPELKNWAITMRDQTQASVDLGSSVLAPLFQSAGITGLESVAVFVEEEVREEGSASDAPKAIESPSSALEAAEE